MTIEANTCWHCGEPLAGLPEIHAHAGGASRPVCCHGCRAAVEWIDQLGLGDYYRLRTEAAPRPRADDAGRDAWQRPEIARHVVRELPGLRCETMLLVDGVRCTGCVWLIERALRAVPGVEDATVNPAARRARVVWRAGEATLPQLLEVLSRAGYHARPLDAQALDDSRRRESRQALKRLVVAGFGAMQSMMFAAVLYLGALDPPDDSTRGLFRWLGFLVATPVVFYSARPFFAGAARSLAARRLGMDVPVAIAIAATYAASVVEALAGRTDRRARMVCALAVGLPGDPPAVEIFTGTVDGSVADAPRGDCGFGYDPIFVLPEGMTAAELLAAEKDRRSHRGRAVEAASPRLRELLAAS